MSAVAFLLAAILLAILFPRLARGLVVVAVLAVVGLWFFFGH
jgi:hypothetical protein